MNYRSLVAAVLLCAACSNSNASPTAPVPINTGTGWSDSPFISRDGQRLYFMYSRYNFAPYIKSGGKTAPVLSGPDRPGLHHSNNPWDESDIYMSTKNSNGTWGEPVALGLNGPYGDAGGMEIDNGNTFVWLQGNGVTANNIVIATKNPDGSWGPATDPGINDHVPNVVQDNPFLTPAAIRSSGCPRARADMAARISGYRPSLAASGVRPRTSALPSTLPAMRISSGARAPAPTRTGTVRRGSRTAR